MVDGLTAVPPGDEKLALFGRWWHVHRKLTEYLVGLFAGVDPGNPCTASERRLFGTRVCVWELPTIRVWVLSMCGWRQCGHPGLEAQPSLTIRSLRRFKEVVFSYSIEWLVYGVHIIVNKHREGEVVDLYVFGFVWWWSCVCIV